MTFYDCHCHLLTNNDAPDGLLGIKLSTGDKFIKWVADKFKWVIPGTEDRLENIAAFLEESCKTREEMLLDLLGQYPTDSVVCVQLVDLSSVTGQARVLYTNQLSEVLSLRTKYPGRIKIFYHSLFGNIITGVDGYKLYPPISQAPNNECYYKLYKYCEADGVPITCHTSPYGVGSPSILNPFAAEKAHPKHWRAVLKRFPRLKVNLAHFGNGRVSWMQEILALMFTYPGVYADVSFSLAWPGFNSTLKYYVDRYPILEERLLFGSDFHMQYLLDKDLSACVRELRIAIGEEMFRKISEINPEKFLFK